MKFLYFLLAIVVIVLVAIETKPMNKIPTVKIHTNSNGAVFASIEGEEAILIF